MPLLTNPRNQDVFVTSYFGKQVEKLYRYYFLAKANSHLHYLFIVNMAMLDISLSKDFKNSPEGRLVSCARRILEATNHYRKQIGAYHE